MASLTCSKLSIVAAVSIVHLYDVGDAVGDVGADHHLGEPLHGLLLYHLHGPGEGIRCHRVNRIQNTGHVQFSYYTQNMKMDKDSWAYSNRKKTIDEIHICPFVHVQKNI